MIYSGLYGLTKPFFFCAVKSPWEEFDREEGALQKGPYGGLGFDENKEPLGWHGGQVLFHAKLHDMARDRKSCTTPQYKLTLEPAELSTSHSFARRFGSKHFLRLKLTKAVLNKNSKQLMDYIRRPLILCGSVFRAFFAKESNVFYVKTNEGTDGKSILPDAPVPGVMSFLEFINWHNPMELNSKQVSTRSMVHCRLAPLNLLNRPWQSMLLDLRLACPILCRASWWINQTSILLKISVSFQIQGKFTNGLTCKCS